MFCNYCGAPNPDDAGFCSTCGRKISRMAAGPSTEAAATPLLPEPVPVSVARAPEPAVAQAPVRRNKAALWILSIVALLGIFVVVMGFISTLQSDTSSSAESFTPYIPASTPDPATPEPPSAVPPDTNYVPSADIQVGNSPSSPPVQPPPPDQPKDSIVGTWKTPLIVGDGYLTFTDEGKIHIQNLLSDEWGVYVFSPADGTLEIQKDSVFSHVVVDWHCQVNGDSLRVIEPEGAAHVYTRVRS